MYPSATAMTEENHFVHVSLNCCCFFASLLLMMLQTLVCVVVGKDVVAVVGYVG